MAPSMRPLILCAASIVAAMAFPASAGIQDRTSNGATFKTGEQLYAACTSKVAAEVDRCEWYLMAAHDMAMYLSDTGEIAVTFCVPAGTKAERLRTIAVEYWRARPASRRFSAVSSFSNALHGALPGPCGG